MSDVLLCGSTTGLCCIVTSLTTTTQPVHCQCLASETAATYSSMKY